MSPWTRLSPSSTASTPSLTRLGSKLSEIINECFESYEMQLGNEETCHPPTASATCTQFITTKDPRKFYLCRKTNIIEAVITLRETQTKK